MGKADGYLFGVEILKDQGSVGIFLRAKYGLSLPKMCLFLFAMLISVCVCLKYICISCI